MVVLLPARDRFEEFDAACTASTVGPIIDRLSPRQVAVTLPKFEFGASFDLTRTLTQMGMRDAFRFLAADFSGIDGGRSLFLSAVIHKALVRVDEKGTEAAAATAVIGMRGGAPARPVAFTADRPFIFLIRDRNAGAILFMGRLVDPRG